MGRENPQILDAVLSQRLDVREERAAGHDHVVAEDCRLAAHATGHLRHLYHVVRRARLVHQREVGVEHLGEAHGLLRAARVGRDRDDSLAREAEIAKVACEKRHRRHVVDGDREEALDLAGVQVHRQHAVGAGELEHVGDQARRNRLARLGLAILARVGEERDDGGDPLRGGELRRLHHEEQLHDVLVDGLATGLDDEDVGAADRLVVAAVGLAVCEVAQLDLAELDAELLGDPPREIGVRAAGEHHQPLLRTALDPVARLVLSHGRLPLEAGKSELSCPAAGLHSPPCSPGVDGQFPAHRPGRPSL